VVCKLVVLASVFMGISCGVTAAENLCRRAHEGVIPSPGTAARTCSASLRARTASKIVSRPFFPQILIKCRHPADGSDCRGSLVGCLQYIPL
jgi:hypothetical protein